MILRKTIIADIDLLVKLRIDYLLDLNLTHNQRPYAFVENVVTDENYRKRGLATACLNYAKEIAQKENCYTTKGHGI